MECACYYLCALVMSVVLRKACMYILYLVCALVVLAAARSLLL